MRGFEFRIEGSGAARAVEKLVQGGVPVLSARIEGKNLVRVCTDGKDRKKVFAIFRGSCYNIIKVRAVAWERLLHACRGAAGMLVGAALFVSAVCFFQGRVLCVRVVGSGACYEAEVRAMLARGGTRFLSPPPQDEALLTAGILALPRVGFCSLHHEGGVLTVRVEVGDEAQLPAGGPLLAPADGVVEKLTLVRGTALVSPGDAVKRGDVVVENTQQFAGVLRETTVIAAVTVCFEVAAEYALPREQALAQAYLDYGELTKIHTEETGDGWRIEGVAHAVAARNLG